MADNKNSTLFCITIKTLILNATSEFVSLSYNLQYKNKWIFAQLNDYLNEFILGRHSIIVIF